jgi:hypothetical protein
MVLSAGLSAFACCGHAAFTSAERQNFAARSPLQQPGACMILEYLGISDIAAQSINRATPTHVHHLKNRGTTLC